MTHRWSSAVFTIALGCSSTTAPPREPAAPAPPAVSPPVATTPPAAAPPVHDFPASRRDDVVETLHGVAVHDPYRWLEDAGQPEVQDWMAAQDGYTRAQLARLPGRDALAARLAEVFYYESFSVPHHRGDRYFFSHRARDQEKYVVLWKQGESGKDRVLLDPNTWSTDGSAGLAGWWPSEDGRYVAYNKTEHNADEATLHVIEVTTGKPLPDTIAGTKYGSAAWTPDGRGFYYVRLPPPSPDIPAADRPGYAELRYHVLGSDPEKDPVIREATHDARVFQGVHVSRDGHWLFSMTQHGWTSNDVYFRDLRKHQRDWTVLVENVPAWFDVETYHDTFYVSTNDGATRRHVLAVDPARPARANWRELVPESDATLEEVTLVGGHLVLSYLRSATSEIAIHDLHGKRLRALDIPRLGNASRVVGLPTEDTVYVDYTSFTEPETIYKASVKTGAITPWAKAQLPLDTSGFVTEQVRYPSKDGTEITMFLLHRKDAVKDGKTPVLLTGYGGFKLSAQPSWSSSRAVWLEHGGMIAVANLRGGGEYGEDWHRAGMLLQKQHVFDDFLAAARWLAASGWTSPEHLAIRGGSNGGLLVGAAITQAPELFKAVVCEVPLLDMVRYHRFASGKTWVPEYGSAEDAEQFQALYAYSPYHHVVQGTKYPALLVSSSDHDDRVDPMHARKFAAEMQWATASDAPVWLRIQDNAGHGGPGTLRQRVEQSTDTYAFLMWQLGMH